MMRSGAALRERAGGRNKVSAGVGVHAHARPHASIPTLADRLAPHGRRDVKQRYNVDEDPSGKVQQLQRGGVRHLGVRVERVSVRVRILLV